MSIPTDEYQGGVQCIIAAMTETHNAHKIIQIAMIGYDLSTPEYLGSTEQLIVLTDNGKLFIRDLNNKGSKWQPLEGPIPGVNIGDPAHADQQPLA